MDINVEYSADKIRETAELGKSILDEISNRAMHILSLLEEIQQKMPASDMNKEYMALERDIEQVISDYRMQLNHLIMAAEFYNTCAQKVYEEAEQTVSKGRETI